MRHRNDLVFPMAEYERRLADLRRRMAEQDLEVVMTTTPENICYLTGFESPGHYYFNTLIVPLEAEPVAVPRRLEDSGYQALSWVEFRRPYEDTQDPMEAVQVALEEFNLHQKRIGYEKNCCFSPQPSKSGCLQTAPKLPLLTVAASSKRAGLSNHPMKSS